MNSEQKYLMHLIATAINEELPQPPEQKLNWKYLLDLSADNQFDNLVYSQLKRIQGLEIPPEIMHTLRQRYGRAIVRNMKQDDEFGIVIEAFESEHIRNMPFKGTVIKKYYTYPDFRRSCDLDILIDYENIERVNEVLLSLGYKCDEYYHIKNDSYTKNDMHIETHNALTTKNNQGYEFCQRVWSEAVQETDYRYTMGNEFMLTYLLVHMKFHLLEMGGGGIKLVTDFWILENTLEIDKEKLHKFLKEANVCNLYTYTVKLYRKWFLNEICDDKNVLMLENFILDSGAYGNYIRRRKITFSRTDINQNGGKIKKLISFIFPSYQVMTEKYPILNRVKLLLPFTYIYRIITSKSANKKGIIKAYASLYEKESKELSAFFDELSK